jgi:hypothetical protein
MSSLDWDVEKASQSRLKSWQLPNACPERGSDKARVQAGVV